MSLSTVKFASWLFVIGVVSVLAFVYMQHKLFKQRGSGFEALRLDVDMTKAELRSLGIKVTDGLFTKEAPMTDSEVQEVSATGEASDEPDVIDVDDAKKV
jgi:hypothetical protein